MGLIGRWPLLFLIIAVLVGLSAVYFTQVESDARVGEVVAHMNIHEMNRNTPVASGVVLVREGDNAAVSAVKDKGKDIAQHAALSTLAPSLVPVAELVSVVGKSKSAYDNYNELKGATTDPAIMKKAICKIATVGFQNGASAESIMKDAQKLLGMGAATSQLVDMVDAIFVRAAEGKASLDAVCK